MRRTQGANTDSLARAVFALLVLACFVAFFLTQRLKHTPTAVQRFELTPFFSPTPAGHIKQERISFRIARNARLVAMGCLRTKSWLPASMQQKYCDHGRSIELFTTT